MTAPEGKYFHATAYTDEQITQYLQNAERDLNIAQKDSFAEVRFTYSYQALIKLGIVLIAALKKARVKSLPGHHVKILEEMSRLLKDEDISSFGNVMRMKRNTDFYGGGTSISAKEADEYLRFVESIFHKARRIIQKR